MSSVSDTPKVGEQAPTFQSLCCDGETFRTTQLDSILNGGAVLIFYGFTYSAVAENWWKRYHQRGWSNFDVPVVGISRAGPYTQNHFLQEMNLPFRLFADVNGSIINAYGLTTNREGMAGVETARRAIFVLDEGRTVTARWIKNEWISPPPVSDIETAINDL